MGGSSTPSNTTQTREMPKWAQPYATNLLERSAQLSERQMPVYQGQRSADMNGYQTAGMNMTAARALGGSPEIAAGSQNITDTLNGAYLNGNPYLQSQINQGADSLKSNYFDATGNTDATFARSGAFGGSAWQNAQQGNAKELATGLGNLENNMRFQNYGMERQNQMNALNPAMAYGNQAYTDAQQLQGTGQQQYAFDQQRLDDYQGMWSDQANSPYRQLDVLASGLSSAVGNSYTGTQTGARPNAAAQWLGGGAALAGLLG